MRRTGNLFEIIASRDNLRLAFHKAMTGKRARTDARTFAASLDVNVRVMCEALLDGTIAVGDSTQFTIHDPKERLITAPCFPDRVLHHAIMNVCEPVFERFLIADTFACRVGKGRIAALHRAMLFSRRFRRVAKLDMRKYFNSISHPELKSRVMRLFKDQRLLGLLFRIIDAHNSTGCGLPIGSLTSQHLANFYLGWFDRFVKEQLRVQGYVRYMDDCILWSDSKAELLAIAGDCQQFLSEELLLQAKPVGRIYSSQQGFDVLGCRVYPEHLKLNERSRRRFRKRMAELDEALNAGDLSEADAQARAAAIVAFTTAGGVRSWKFRKRHLARRATS